jgi:hypothetical protein
MVMVFLKVCPAGPDSSSGADQQQPERLFGYGGHVSVDRAGRL